MVSSMGDGRLAEVGEVGYLRVMIETVTNNNKHGVRLRHLGSYGRYRICVSSREKGVDPLKVLKLCWVPLVPPNQVHDADKNKAQHFKASNGNASKDRGAESFGMAYREELVKKKEVCQSWSKRAGASSTETSYDPIGKKKKR
ncbi:hypothetical protein J6590_103019 [Homalodisca vitripennis]|nr:hypothetical protein J6590_103019 [Homalodisca vitripennis]